MSLFPVCSNAPAGPHLAAMHGTRLDKASSASSTVSRRAMRQTSSRIRQQQIDILQKFMQNAIPHIIGIVVCIQRNGEAGMLQIAKQCGQVRRQRFLQKERGEMEMFRRCQIVKIEVGARHSAHRSRIGKNSSLGAMMQQYGNACAGRIFRIDNFGKIGPAFGHPFQRNPAKLIFAQAR